VISLGQCGGEVTGTGVGGSHQGRHVAELLHQLAVL